MLTSKNSLKKKQVETRPFTCFLDLGLNRATVGNRVFAALKGAVDGGLHIPHSDKIFPKVKDGKDKDKKGKKDDKTAKDDKKATGGNPLRDRIFGNHIQQYMDLIKKNDEKYKKHFSKWADCLAKAKVTKLEDLYKKAHKDIRAKPLKVKKQPGKKVTHEQDKKDKNIRTIGTKKYRKDMKLLIAERKQRVTDKIKKYFDDKKKTAKK